VLPEGFPFYQFNTLIPLDVMGRLYVQIGGRVYIRYCLLKHVSVKTTPQSANHIVNKSAKLTQNTSVVFVVNLIVMTTTLGAGYSTWRADTAYSGFGQFKGHNSGVEELGDYITWSRYYAHQHIHKG